MILVISQPGDQHATAVLAGLAAQGTAAELVNLAEFPRAGTLALGYGPAAVTAELQLAERRLDMRAASVIWWRRPQPFVLHDEVRRGSHRTFAYNECLEAFAGMWQMLEPLWINHPTRDEVAARKAYQLKVARDVGLRVPRTLITNDGGAARQFADSVGDACIYKAFSATVQEWRETRLLGDREKALFDAVRYAPVIFQEYIDGVDLRITIVGDRLFPAAINANESRYKVDFRMDMFRAPMEPATLPAEIEHRLLAFMRALGLVYGAIDMRRTPEGEYVFLEINPSGQWLFVEERTKQPITAALVDACIAATPIRLRARPAGRPALAAKSTVGPQVVRRAGSAPRRALRSRRGTVGSRNS